MKKINKIFALILILAMFMPVLSYAAPPDNHGDMNKESVSYSGNTTYSEDKNEDGKTYSSTLGGENALLVSQGTSNVTNINVTKSGDESGDSSDFYGTNAAILCYNNAILNIDGGKINTNGAFANALFAYGTGTINANNLVINTTSNNSGGIMVTGGGILNATNLTVTTEGNSSAAIRSDRGGGTLTVTGGDYTANGVGSPSIYSTATVVVENATLTSTKSEGVVVEGANSVYLDNVKLTDSNSTLNGNSETYKNIFLYQSMSGDAENGVAYFRAENSNIVTNKGDTIFITNTKAAIDLENNTITNNDNGALIRIQKGKWGNAGSNGGEATLSLTNQKVNGDVIVDDISTLYLNLNAKSYLEGAIDTDNEANYIYLTISSDSVLNLTDDSYLDELSNGVSDNSNIYLNGHKLYVNGEEVSANTGTYVDSENEENEDNTNTEKEKDNNILYVIVLVILIFAIFGTAYFLTKKKTSSKIDNNSN